MIFFYFFSFFFSFPLLSFFPPSRSGTSLKFFFSFLSPSRSYPAQAHPGYEMAKLTADSDALLGLSAGGADDAGGSPVATMVNDLSKDFGSDGETQVMPPEMPFRCSFACAWVHVCALPHMRVWLRACSQNFAQVVFMR